MGSPFSQSFPRVELRSLPLGNPEGAPEKARREAWAARRGGPITLLAKPLKVALRSW